MRRTCAACVAGLAGFVLTAPAVAVPLVDPGFETFDVPAGYFVQPRPGAWVFTNDAGVVKPPAPNSSERPLFTWSATRPAFEGQQYASTYAGGDTIRQAVTFDSAGRYELSVAAFAPVGRVTIPGSNENLPLVDGTFRFWLDRPVGPEWTVLAGSDWATYSTIVNVPAPGTYDVGVSNPVLDSYFINYDAFAVRAVPEPTAVAGVAVVLSVLVTRRRAKPGDRDPRAQPARTLALALAGAA